MENYDKVKYENGEMLFFKGTFFGIPIYAKNINDKEEENQEITYQKSTDQTEIW
jgi:hypothetical protein